MDVKFPRKLNFNAPLLSTRHPGGHIGEEIACTNSQGASKHTSDRIPFCWEQAPGQPKDCPSDNIHDGELDTPRPRPPPGCWQSTKAASFDDDVRAFNGCDDSCDGDVDDDVDDNDDVFSSAMDVLSLTEAIDIAEKREKKHGLEGLHFESVKHSECPSPSFIIERFLPDATALAESSTLNFSKNLNKKLPYSCNYSEKCVSRAVRQSHPSLKGCGLEVLFPWRMKHKLCGVKSPVCQDASIVQPRCGAKQKKHCSSANTNSNRPFRDVNRNI